ncbi:MAG: hypothetical protein KBB38_10865 [Bacteroidia bacterium]|nr:hypothetical protein [Bacteroidia bacterium]MBP7728765.1 hypothetical protein [Bacteroidia bacterium]
MFDILNVAWISLLPVFEKSIVMEH